MQNILDDFKQAGVKFSDEVTTYCIPLDQPLYIGDIKSLIVSGALDKDSLFELFTNEKNRVTIDINKLPKRKLDRLVKIYLKGVLLDNHTICPLEEGYPFFAEVSVARNGFYLETTLGIKRENFDLRPLKL